MVDPENFSSPFAIIRTPLLSYNQLRDFYLQQTPLQYIYTLYKGNPYLLQALNLAAPELYEELSKLDKGFEQKSNKALSKLYYSLLRYFIRICTKSTPFGLFAGYDMIKITNDGSKFLRRSPPNNCDVLYAFDYDFINQLATSLERNLAIQRELTYSINSSLYQMHNTLKLYQEVINNNTRSYKKYAVNISDVLIKIIKCTKNRVSYYYLKEKIVEESYTPEETEEYLSSLINEQVLISNLHPPLTSANYALEFANSLMRINTKLKNKEIDDLIYFLQAKPEKTNLNEIMEVVQYLKNGVQGYRKFVSYSWHKCINITLKAPVQGSIGNELRSNILEAANLVRNLSSVPIDDMLKPFKEAFYKKFEFKEIPLTLALDPDTGIDLNYTIEKNKENILPFSKGYDFEWKLELYNRALKDKKIEIVLSNDDVLSVVKENDILPQSFYILGTAFNKEDNLFFILETVAGMSSINLFSRFCTNDEALKNEVQKVLTYEESLEVDYIKADIIHLPVGKLGVGNLVVRPVNRFYEIPFLSNPNENVTNIDINELTIKLNDAFEIELRTKQKRYRILPRLTNAHNFGSRTSPPIYRLLSYLQYQGKKTTTSWDWGLLSNQPFLPRIVYKNIIISLATWNIKGAELRKIKSLKDEDCLKQFTEIKEEYQLPKFVLLKGKDGNLLVDLDNIHSIRILISHAEGMNVQCIEFVHHLGNSFIKQEDGQDYTNEIIIPYIRTNINSERQSQLEDIQLFNDTFIKFPIGSKWLYFKIYVGKNYSDIILQILVSECYNLVNLSFIQNWFFIRYSDPEPHLRLRIKLEDVSHLNIVISCFYKVINIYIKGHIISNIAIDTYIPETERYGSDTIQQAEEIFYYDSICVVELIKNIFTDEKNEPLKLVTAIYSIHNYFDIFTLTLDSRLALAKKMWFYYHKEFTSSKDDALKKRLSMLRKKEKRLVEHLLFNGEIEVIYPDIEKIKGSFLNFSDKTLPIIQEVKTKLTNVEALNKFITSVIHMFFNRFYSDNQRFFEFIAYDIYLNTIKSYCIRKKINIIQ